MAADGAVFSVYRDAGEVAHVLVRACKLVEQRGFAAVLIANQSEGEGTCFRGFALGMTAVVAGAGKLAEARMVDVLMDAVLPRRGKGLVAQGYVDVLSLFQAQGKLEASHRYLDRVAHGRHFLQGDCGIGS